MQSKERKFGEIPAWAKVGPITGKNYAYRAEAYCAALADTRGHSHPTIRKDIPEFYQWWEYFTWLGRIPVGFQVIINEPHSQREFTVPETNPELFDMRFVPTKGWRPPRENWEDQTPQERAVLLEKLWQVLSGYGFKSPYYGAPPSKGVVE